VFVQKQANLVAIKAHEKWYRKRSCYFEDKLFHAPPIAGKWAIVGWKASRLLKLMHTGIAIVTAPGLS
jgi:hypothetical protein